MKVRHGFVSNSSSTSFTFCFKGNIKNLRDLILNKYSKFFNRSYLGYNDTVHKCNALEVIEAIEKCVKERSKSYDNVSLISIDKFINDGEKYLETINEDIEEEKMQKKNNGDRHWLLESLMERKQENKQKIERMKKIKRKGLNSVLVIEFGDNHGSISGGDLGYAMDYDGRDIDIDKEDFVVFTEQNR